MLKTVIVLPDGTELSSGGHAINAVQSVTLTECVNSGEELTLGSTCANAMEATLLTPKGGLAIAAGAEVKVYKEDPTGFRIPVGIFILEKPTRPSANTMKLTGYDRVSKLDKDLTAWLSGLDGWPYQLTTFAGMVCEACGLTFEQSHVANEDTFLVQQFSRSSVTGRQIMRWLGEIGCRFCHATAEGDIEFAWYEDSKKTITTSGDLYYFQNGLTYEDFNTAPIDAVQIRLADSEDGALWPEAGEGANSYIITGNPILNAKVTNELEEVLDAIKAELVGVTYTPCKVEISANMDIRAGNTVKITDKNGKTITAYVMTKTQTGQKDTLECTGSSKRDSATVVNNPSRKDVAENAMGNMTQKQIFLKLTNNGKLKGLFMKDGELYVDASFLATGVISSSNGKIIIDLTGDSEPVFNTGISTNGLIIRSDEAGAKELCEIRAYGQEGNYNFEMSAYSAIGGEIFHINEVSSRGYVQLEIKDASKKFNVKLAVDEDSAGVDLFRGNSGRRVLSIKENGDTNLSVDKINGKSVRWVYLHDIGHYVPISDDE